MGYEREPKLLEFSSSCFSAGCGILFYEWLYKPLMVGWGVEPWSIASWGAFNIALGVGAAALHFFVLARITQSSR